MTAVETTTLVRSQYEWLPYPPRDPEEERRRLVESHTHALPLVTALGFAGRRDLRAGARVLVAGSGTGDGEVFLGEQLRDADVEIVAIDLSSTSIEIARRRAEIRGLTNIRWIQGSLLDLPGMGVGAFDYVACTGVLHHLEDPDAGLAALRAVLAPGGALGLMVYGRYGRAAVYQMQTLLRLLLEDTDDPTRRLDLTRAVLSHLPVTNWFARTQDLVRDHVSHGDAGIVDLLLHPTDRAYSVPELYDLVEAAGLTLIDFVHHRAAYDPAVLIVDPAVRDEVLARPRRERQAIAELLGGGLTRHFVYCAVDERDPAAPADDMVPYLWADRNHREVAETLEEMGECTLRSRTGARLRVTRRTPATVRLFEALDGRTPVGRLGAGLSDEMRELVLEEFQHWWKVMHYGHQLVLRHRSIAPFTLPGEKGA